MLILLKVSNFLFSTKNFFNKIVYTILSEYQTMGEQKIQTWSLQSSW